MGLGAHYNRNYDDRWCSLQCARKFANAMANAGKRLVEYTGKP